MIIKKDYMGRLKFIVLSLISLVIIVVVIVAVLIATLDDDDYRGILTWAFDYFTDYRIHINGPLTLDISMTPTLTLSDFDIEHDHTNAQPVSAHINNFKIRLALKSLLIGTVHIKELLIEDATVSFIESGVPLEEEEEWTFREKLDDIDIPILESVALRNISTTYSDKDTGVSLQVNLRSFTIDDVGNVGPVYVQGDGAVNNADFIINGQFGSVAEALAHAQPYPVDLSLDVAGLELSVSGTIDDPVEGEGFNIVVSAKEGDLSTIIKVFGIDIPQLGQLSLGGTITGNVEAPGILNLAVELSGSRSVTLSVNGELPNIVSGEGTDIILSASCSNKTIIRSLLPGGLHDFNGFSLEGRLHEINRDFAFEDIRVSAFQQKGITVQADGRIVLDEIMTVPGIKNTDMRLRIESPGTVALKPFLFDWIPDAGPVSAEARIAGTGEILSLNDITIMIGESNALRFEATGRVGSIPIHLPGAISDIDLTLSLSSAKLESFLAGYAEPIREWDIISAQAHLRGSADQLYFDEVVAHMEEEEGVTADVRGSVIVEQRNDTGTLGKLDLSIAMAAPTISSFRNLLAAKALPDLGPVRYTTRLQGTTEGFSLEDILLQAGYPGPVRLEWRGRIGNVVFDSDTPVSDIDLVGTAYIENTSLLSPYVGMKIPDLGPLEETSKIAARKGGYGVDDIQVVIGDKKKGWLRGKGRIEYVMRGTDVAFEGIDMNAVLQDIDSTIITSAMGMEESDLGMINGNLSVVGSMKDLTVSNAELDIASPEGVKISARGDIRHIRAERTWPFEGINIDLNASVPDMTGIRSLTGLELPDLGALSMNVRVKDRDGSLDIDTLRVRTGPKDAPTLLIEGDMHDILSTDQMAFTVSFEAATRPWLEQFYDHPVPEDHRLKGRATLSGSSDNFIIEGSAQSGETHIESTIQMSRVNERSHLSAHVSTPEIYLDDLGIYPQFRERKKSAEKDTEASRDTIFSDESYSFDRMKKLDAVITLDIKKIAGKDFTLKDLDIDISLDNGLLSLGPARMSYADGFLSVAGEVDTRLSKPEMKVKLTAEDIDVTDLLAYAHSPLILAGHLNMAVDLQSKGSSPREIASNLNGEIGLALENGQVKKLADLLGADAIDFVSTHRKLDEYQELHCLALRFNFVDGIGESQVIYVDTPSVRSRGKGTVDLHEETMDLVIQPKPKKGRLGGSSAVSLAGPLNEPSASKVPFREAARLYGEIAMPFAFLPARAIGYVWYLMKNDKDESSPCLTQEYKAEPQNSDVKKEQ